MNAGAGKLFFLSMIVAGLTTPGETCCLENSNNPEEVPSPTPVSWESLPRLVEEKRIESDVLRHPADVMAATFSPNGQELLTTDNAGSLRFWDLATRRERSCLAIQAPSGDFSISPDGKRACFVDHDEFHAGIFMWNLITEKREHILQEVAGYVRGEWGSRTTVYKDPVSRAFSPDGRILATGRTDGSVRFWDVSSGKSLGEFKPGDGTQIPRLLPLAFSPNGQSLAIGAGNTVEWWDISTLKRTLKGEGHLKEIQQIAYAPDGTAVATAGADDTIHLWEADTGREILTFQGHTCGVSSLAFTPDGKKIVTSGRAGLAVVWDAARGRELHRIDLGKERKAALSPDGRMIAIPCGASVALWDLQTGKAVVQPPVLSGEVSSLAYSPDGTMLLTGGNRIWAWDAKSMTPRQSLQNDNASMDRQSCESGGNFTFSKDGHHFTGGMLQNKILVSWDASSLKSGQVFGAKGSWDAYTARAFSPDGVTLGAGLNNGLVRFWELARGWEVAEWKAHKDSVLDMAFLPDGKTLLTAGGDDSLRFWDMATHQETRSIPYGGRFVLTPDGTCAVAAKNGELGWIDLVTGCVCARIDMRRSPLDGLALSGDGRLVASHNHHSVVVWELATASPFLHLEFTREGVGEVASLAFTPDSRSLAAGMTREAILFWSVDSTVPAEAGESSLDTLWEDLAGIDAVRGRRAVNRMSAAGGRAVAYLKERTSAVQFPPERLKGLLADLDSADFGTRESAARELSDWAPLARDSMEETIRKTGSAEVKSRLAGILGRIRGSLPLPAGHHLRLVRAIEVLERISTLEARQVLETLAKGTPALLATRHAQAALNRTTKEPDR